MAQSLNALAVGALVKDTGTLYNGKPIIWKIADKGHTGYPSGAVTLITERIISLKCFDAIESGNSDGNRRSYGNNRWTLSNVRQWLNSQAAAGKCPECRKIPFSAAFRHAYFICKTPCQRTKKQSAEALCYVFRPSAMIASRSLFLTVSSIFFCSNSFSLKY